MASVSSAILESLCIDNSAKFGVDQVDGPLLPAPAPVPKRSRVYVLGRRCVWYRFDVCGQVDVVAAVATAERNLTDVLERQQAQKGQDHFPGLDRWIVDMIFPPSRRREQVSTTLRFTDRTSNTLASSSRNAALV